MVLGDSRLTYAQVNAAANQVANLLVSRGIEPGDKVALSCANLPYFPIVYYGILKAGATVVPLNVLLKGREVAYHLDDSDAKAYFCFQGTPDLPIGAEGHAGFEQADGCEHFFVITVDPAAESPIEGTQTLGQALKGQAPIFETREVGADDTAVILYTSGTTGQPKGAELMHRNMISNALSSDALFGADAERTRHAAVRAAALPLVRPDRDHERRLRLRWHGRAAAALRGRPGAGADGQGGRHLLRRRPDDVLGTARRAGRLGCRRARSSPRRCASPRPAAPRCRWRSTRSSRRRFGVTILEGYGLSETSPVASFSVWGEPARVGSIGKPIPGVEMKLINPEPGVREDLEDGTGRRRRDRDQGPQHHEGLLRPPRGHRRGIVDGWFRSGDLGRKDEDGWYYIVDRSKDMIIRGGYNVYPREIEEVLLTHPDVSLAAVIGVPHESHGEEIKAVVIRKDGARRDRGRADGVGQGADGRLQVPPADPVRRRRCR